MSLTTLRKTTRETMQFGRTMLKLFKDIVHFFESHSSTEKLIEVCGCDEHPRRYT